MKFIPVVTFVSDHHNLQFVGMAEIEDLSPADVKKTVSELTKLILDRRVDHKVDIAIDILFPAEAKICFNKMRLRNSEWWLGVMIVVAMVV